MSLLERLKNSGNLPARKGSTASTPGAQPAAAPSEKLPVKPAPAAAPAPKPVPKPVAPAPVAPAPKPALAQPRPTGLASALAEKRGGSAGVQSRLAAKKGDVPEKDDVPQDPYRELKDRIQGKLIQQIDQDAMNAIENPEDRRDFVKGNIQKILQVEAVELNLSLSRQISSKIIEDMVDDVLGLGPLEVLLRDEEVKEIMVNGPNRVYVERAGKRVLSDVRFRDNHHVLHILEKIVQPLGRRIDESSPMVDARLQDGSRVNAVIPPLALCGPTITIRKFEKEPLTMQSLIDFGTLTQEMADFLAACVKIRLNIFCSGGAGSGKTTTLNVLSAFIPNDERIITIEDAAELRLGQDHVVSLETRPPNIEGKGEVSMRELVKNCLRMRPERIIVGEVRSSEALDMLQAMNTGHDGSTATGHSNSPKDMISRLETMVMMAGFDMPSKAIREQIAGAVDLVVQQNKLRDGTRKIVAITEVQGMEGDQVILADIFKFVQTGVAEGGKILGDLRPTGIRPKFYHKFLEEGIVLPDTIFEAKDAPTDGGGY